MWRRKHEQYWPMRCFGRRQGAAPGPMPCNPLFDSRPIRSHTWSLTLRDKRSRESHALEQDRANIHHNRLRHEIRPPTATTDVLDISPPRKFRK